MHSNNPILEVVKEASKENPIRTFDAIVSIGCGLTETTSPAGGVSNFFWSLVSRVTDTELRHEEFLRDFSGLRDVYFRFQEMEKLGPIDLADSGKLDVVADLAREYLKSAAGKKEIQRCAKKLSRKGRNG